eukprot:scaffold3586_cov404-Prasinococcus_capsulatus_cf.AAC.11
MPERTDGEHGVVASLRGPRRLVKLSSRCLMIYMYAVLPSACMYPAGTEWPAPHWCVQGECWLKWTVDQPALVASSEFQINRMGNIEEEYRGLLGPRPHACRGLVGECSSEICAVTHSVLTGHIHRPESTCAHLKATQT